MGAINPTEPTSASVAAHAAVVMYGVPECLWLSDSTIHAIYEGVKAPCMHVHACVYVVKR